MEKDLMSEVEQEISRILNKNKKNNVRNDDFCDGHNLEKCLAYLSEEFDYFDVSRMTEPFDLSNHSSVKNVLVQLVNSSYKLIKHHRDVQKKQHDALELTSKLSSDVRTLTKTVDSLRKEITIKDKQLQINKEKSCLDRIENNDLKNKINTAKKEINTIQKESISEKTRHKHELQRVMSEGRRLENRFRQNCGDYTSKEGQIVSVIDNYKKNEEKHLEMISKLQLNNHELLEEILVLKGELAEVSFKNRTKKLKE